MRATTIVRSPRVRYVKTQRLEQQNYLTTTQVVQQDWDTEPYDDEVNKQLEPFEADLLDAAGRPILMHSLNDVLINAEVLLCSGVV